MVFSKFRRNPTAHARLKDDGKGGDFFFPARKNEDKRPMLNTSSDENEERDEKWIAAFKKSEHSRMIPVEQTMQQETNIIEPTEDIPKDAFTAEEVMTAALHLKSPKAEESITPRAGTPTYLPAAITPSLGTKREKPEPAIRETSSSTFGSESTKQTSNTLDHKDTVIASLKTECAKLRDKVLQYGDVDRYMEPDELSKLEQEKYDLKKQLKVVNSELKFTQSALEDAMNKMQTQSQSSAELKEEIDNQKDQIDELETKQLSLETDKMELTEQLKKEKAELENKLEQREDELHDMKLQYELLEKELRDVRWQLDKANSGVVKYDEERAIAAPKNASDSEESVFEGVDDSPKSTSPNPFDDEESVSSSYRDPFNDENSQSGKPAEANVESTNPFDAFSENDKLNTMQKQQSMKPFSDSDKSTNDNRNKSINPFEDDRDDNDAHALASARFVEQEAMMQKQLSDMQAKYAQKMADQLSKIAALEEENDIKDIQLEQLKESLDKQTSKKSNRRSFNWRRKDNDDELEKTWHPHLTSY